MSEIPERADHVEQILLSEEMASEAVAEYVLGVTESLSKLKDVSNIDNYENVIADIESNVAELIEAVKKTNNAELALKVGCMLTGVMGIITAIGGGVTLLTPASQLAPYIMVAGGVMVSTSSILGQGDTFKEIESTLYIEHIEKLCDLGREITHDYLIDGGAEYETTEDGTSTVRPTEEQLANMQQEMNDDLKA